MSELIAKALVLIALTCVPIGITVGFLTDDRYRNPFCIYFNIIFTYVGATIWVKIKKRKTKIKDKNYTEVKGHAFADRHLDIFQWTIFSLCQRKKGISKGKKKLIM